VILYMVHDVRDPRYQLHVRPGKGVRQAVFDWVVPPYPADAGPPPTIVEVFADALAGIGRVAFIEAPRVKLHDDAWQSVGGEHWMPLPRRFLRPRFALAATRDAARIRTMFDGIPDWTQQFQLGLVLRDDALPVLSGKHVERLVTARDVPLEALELPDAIGMLILPGVDGALIEVAARDDRMFDDLRAGVTAGCRRRGIEFDVRPEIGWPPATEPRLRRRRAR
jgi:hypothetical protein